MANQEIENAITSAASGGIKKASGDAGSVETHTLKDMIEADRYLCGKAAAGEIATSPTKTPFIIQRIRSGGTT